MTHYLKLSFLRKSSQKIKKKKHFYDVETHALGGEGEFVNPSHDTALIWPILPNITVHRFTHLDSNIQPWSGYPDPGLS